MRDQAGKLQRLVVEDADASNLAGLLRDVQHQFESPDSESFLESAPVISLDLPRSITKFLAAFRQYERDVVAAVSVPSMTRSVPPTPANWWSVDQSSVSCMGFALVLLSSVLGEVFSWPTQQGGRVIHDVMPIAGKEDEQLGCSSLTPLSWHTEDAFHAFRGDYVGIACLRNDEQVPTTIIPITGLDLLASTIEILREPRFYILPDNSHMPSNNCEEGGADSIDFGRILANFSRPTLVSPLFGDTAKPYLRVDPDFMRAAPGDVEASNALVDLFAAIERNVLDVVMSPGDFLFIDNFRSAHGRRAFSPKYDGRDRWIRRVNISRNLRAARAAGVCRVRAMT